MLWGFYRKQVSHNREEKRTVHATNQKRLSVQLASALPNSCVENWSMRSVGRFMTCVGGKETQYSYTIQNVLPVRGVGWWNYLVRIKGARGSSKVRSEITSLNRIIPSCRITDRMCVLAWVCECVSALKPAHAGGKQKPNWTNASAIEKRWPMGLFGARASICAVN